MKITHQLASIDFRQVRALLAESYWVPGISLARVRKLAANSFLVAAILDSKKKVLAYGRVVSDGSRFAYLADVIVHPDHRGQGLGKKVVSALLHHRRLQEVDQWLLQTRDAHSLYADFGFHGMEFPERVMTRRKGEGSRTSKS